jgi:hypothetical protein
VGDISFGAGELLENSAGKIINDKLWVVSGESDFCLWYNRTVISARIVFLFCESGMYLSDSDRLACDEDAG